MKSVLQHKVFLTAFSINLFASLGAFADTSYELSCRNRAKEIAAETYKNCVTEQRQTQLQQIREEYKEKLADLKNHYDRELKKLSGKQVEGPVEQTKVKTQIKTTARNIRPSGARSLPKKGVRTEVIDLTTPSPVSSQAQMAAPADEGIDQSQNRLKTETENPQDVEIVELPTQE